MNNSILKGQLIQWDDKKGFGFINPELGDCHMFIHISSLKNMPRKPIVGDIIFYQIHTDHNGKQRAVNSKIKGLEKYNNKARTKRNTGVRKTNKKNKIFTTILIILILFFIGSYVISYFLKLKSYNDEYKDTTQFNNPIEYSARKIPEPEFSCSGKTYCSEMNSCREATFYLRKCPNTKIDGDHDGVPCERQWCN